MSNASDRIESYATAFLEVARTEGHLAEVEDELFRFARAYAASDELRLALTDPNLPAARKVAVIQDLLERKALATSQALVLAVVVAGRAGELEQIVDKFVELAVAERAHEVAEVRTAVPLSDEDVVRLRDALSAATRKNVEVKVVIDPDVMGGIVTKVGDLVIDGSVRHRLDQLREQI
ncbi:MAG TPA: ATP synthase F1 subunit delta [Acidimicrobiia bacterium]|nr:ATP synthase F1 subunit delta [Acidimicrobiia bacterium]